MTAKEQKTLETEIAKINNFLRFSENFYQKYRKFKV